MPLINVATLLVKPAATTVFKDVASLVAVWLAFYAAYVLLVAVHESGHLVVGIACGFRVKEFRVSCLRWQTRWDLDWRGMNVLSGWVNMQLTRPDDMMRLRHLLFVTAGPLANLVFAALLYPIAARQSTLGGIAKYLFVGSTLLAVASLIPIKARKLKSDGLQILSTLFDRKGFETLRFHIRCHEAAPILQELRDRGDWAGVKELTERLLALSASIRAKQEVVQRLNTILLSANGQLAETATAAK
jgi:Peptidase family M50